MSEDNVVPPVRLHLARQALEADRAVQHLITSNILLREKLALALELVAALRGEPVEPIVCERTLPDDWPNGWVVGLLSYTNHGHALGMLGGIKLRLTRPDGSDEVLNYEMTSRGPSAFAE